MTNSLHRRILSLTLIALLGTIFSSRGYAQFYTVGTDPGSTKWNTISTQNFKLIYPIGLDSLAKEYGTALEKYYTPVGGSIGYKPNQKYKRPNPVILHPFNVYANGSVVWAPRRMDLYTIMDAYGAESMPWIKNLAVHESRHLSQMQFGNDGYFKPIHWFFGQMWTGALSAIYPGPAFLEGDAVTTETALTTEGRGRSADFLEWYRLSFDKGDMRSWYQWRYGSQKYYTPNHYTIGYMTIAGTRYTFDAPTFTERYFQRITHGFPIRINNLQKTIKEYSHKNFKKSTEDIFSSFQNIWAEEDKYRITPIQTTRLTQEEKRYTLYQNSTFVDNDIYCIKVGLTEAGSLVKISPDGKQQTIRPFTSSSSKLVYSPSTKRIYWSESISDPRWDLAGQSLIRYIDNGDKKIKNLTSEGRFFNPAVSPDGQKIIAVSYPIIGGSEAVIIDAKTGDILSNIKAPNKDIQIVEVAWNSEGIFASGIAEDGYGIYKYSENKWSELLRPNASKIKNLQPYGKGIVFTCDMSGVNEIYSLVDNNLSQLTSTKYGASDPLIKDNEIYFSNLDSDGKGIVKASVNPVAQNLTYSAHTYPIADKLSEQEKGLAATSYQEAEFSEVKRYRKVPHLPHIHSWAPIYFNYDTIDDLSFDYTYEDYSLGATVLFQNELSSLQGSLGYSYHKDEYDSDKWRNSLHLNLLYEGRYPVFEFNLNYNDRSQIQYGWKDIIYDNDESKTLKGKILSKPSVKGNLKIYVPLSRTSSGWYRGLIPQVKYSFTNDWFNTSKVLIDETGVFDVGGVYRFIGSENGKNVLMHNLTTSVRGYIIRPVTNSAIYSRLGIGLELGYKSRIGTSDVFNSNAYVYSYGYLPGIMPSHSIKITAMAQRQIGNGFYRENAVTTRPRGFENSELSSYLAKNEKNQVKLTVDYAMPILPVDWDFLCPLFYIKNFEVIPHADFSPISLGNLFSVGTDLNVRLGNFLWLPYDTTIGISIDLNGGSAYNALKDTVADLSKTYIGFNFNIDL